MILRYTISFIFALMITFALFLGLYFLIAPGNIDILDKAERIRVDLGRVRDVEEVRRQERLPQEVVPVPAPISTIQMSYDVGNVSDPVNFSSGAIGDSAVMEGFGMSFVADGEYLPIVRVLPQYPARAAERGIEGYVIVEFTVTPNGSTTNISVIESSERVFERNAIRAAERFKYKPKVVDGEPVKVDGVRTRIDFKLEQE